MDFWEIYDRYYSRVHGYASSMLRDRGAADDVVQETFLRAQANLDVLREPEKLPAWLFRIAHNLCMDHLRARQSSRVDAATDPESAGACESSRVERDLERGEMSSCVRAKIDTLPANDRAVILLYDLKELSQQEIADVLGIEVGAVKVRLHRARKKLRAVLENECSFSRDERDVLICDPKPPDRR
jgi:RNA polymerase sigma-70 factor (ECF subfamily)